MTGEFFGLEFYLPHSVWVGFMFISSALCFWTVQKAVKSGVHEWRGDRVSRAENPGLFTFHVGLTAFLGLVAVAGGIGMAFDLRIEP